LSQEALAEMAGFHRTFVSQVEREMNNISVDNIERLAEALGVDILELLAKPK
jgi:transcriptional regulator with XRE-family HTH domain